jgi:hypothetical protein
MVDIDVFSALTSPVRRRILMRLRQRHSPLGDLANRFDLESPLSRRAFEGMKPGWPMVLECLAAVLGPQLAAPRGA